MLDTQWFILGSVSEAGQSKLLFCFKNLHLFFGKMCPPKTGSIGEPNLSDFLFFPNMLLYFVGFWGLCYSKMAN